MEKHDFVAPLATDLKSLPGGLRSCGRRCWKSAIAQAKHIMQLVPMQEVTPTDLKGTWKKIHLHVAQNSSFSLMYNTQIFYFVGDRYCTSIS